MDQLELVFLRAFIDYFDFREVFINYWKGRYFYSVEYRIIYYLLKDEWLKNNRILTKKDLIFRVKYLKKSLKNRESIIEIINQIYSLNISDYTESYLKESLLELFKRRRLQELIKNVLSYIEKKNQIDENHLYNDFLTVLQTSFEKSNKNFINYYDGNFEERLDIIKEMQNMHFKTLLNKDLDDILKLKRKNLVAVSAQLGVGKSLFLCNLAVNFTKSGHNVLYLSLEMDKYDISKRIDRIILDLNKNDYYLEKENVKDLFFKYKCINCKLGNLYIADYPPRTLTTHQIKSILQNFKFKNILFDVILIDYLTLMRPNSNNFSENMYQRGKEIAEELLSLAKEENVLIFTALQVKSWAYGKEKQGADTVSESLAIPQLLDVLINLVQIIDDETDEKYFMINFEKARDFKLTKRRIFLKLLDNLRIVDVSDEEAEKLETFLDIKKKPKKEKEAFNVLEEYLDEIIK